MVQRFALDSDGSCSTPVRANFGNELIQIGAVLVISVALILNSTGNVIFWNVILLLFNTNILKELCILELEQQNGLIK